MMEELCKPEKIWLYLAGVAGYAILEFWLGRTGKVRSASLIDLIVMGIMLMGTIIIARLRKKTDDGKSGTGSSGNSSSGSN